VTAPLPFAWVLYDGACGFCSRWVPAWEGTLKKRGFAVATLQEPWVAEKLRSLGVTDVTQLDDFRILVAGTGELISGADAYRFALRRIGWARPIWILSVTPGLRRLFDLGYRAFAANRHRISKACGLDRNVGG
jgi:predicted DCC family thiol-disulfide oxidoreductase YuxK